MYLEHFKLQDYPFTITPNTHYYCALPSHNAALNTLLFSVRSGEGFIKIVGEVGTGKTLLCRLLMERLTDEFVTVYIPNPDLNPSALRRAVAKELGIDYDANVDDPDLIDRIYQRLLELHKAHKAVVLLCDEAQALPTESLEALRLLTNLETETTKLLQVVLFGQPELDQRLNQKNLRQLKQRISFSYTLMPLKRGDLSTYLYHRVAVAGYTYGSLFSHMATNLLFRASRGMPRVVNLAAHKALLVAYGRGEKQVSFRAMYKALKDTQGARLGLLWRGLLFGVAGLVALVIVINLVL